MTTQRQKYLSNIFYCWLVVSALHRRIVYNKINNIHLQNRLNFLPTSVILNISLISPRQTRCDFFFFFTFQTETALNSTLVSTNHSQVPLKDICFSDALSSAIHSSYCLSPWFLCIHMRRLKDTATSAMGIQLSDLVETIHTRHLHTSDIYSLLCRSAPETHTRMPCCISSTQPPSCCRTSK